MENTRIESEDVLISPLQLKNHLNLPIDSREFIAKERREIENIIQGKDNRIIVVVGPCSIHDSLAAIEYSRYLSNLKYECSNELLIIMRTYFSKPRTTVGWKGYVYDPDLNNSYDITKGLYSARETLLKILSNGVSCSMEHLDTIIPQYFDDLLTWAAIGARTTESQIHRELASGCSIPIGFKNGTGGSIDLAINAIESSNMPHNFLGCNSHGMVCKLKTLGNKNSHIILRGSNSQPNYYPEVVEDTVMKLKSKGLNDTIFIDCSHGNSQKKHKNQIRVTDIVSQQIASGNTSIKGIMIESNLVEGNQSINNKPLVYGQSITDACIGLDDTYKILKTLQKAKLDRDRYLNDMVLEMV